MSKSTKYVGLLREKNYYFGIPLIIINTDTK